MGEGTGREYSTLSPVHWWLIGEVPSSTLGYWRWPEHTGNKEGSRPCSGGIFVPYEDCTVFVG